MKLLMGTFTNFGSYEHLSFDFENQGLALIYGNTGAGKSTIADLACWTLFGETAKGGNVDEVRSWTALREDTSAYLDVETSSGIISIHRARSASSKQNDLYWLESDQPGDEPRRGKDLQDTQKLLNARLGVDPDFYMTASYFHEFAPTASFFTSKAKERRELFDKLTDTSLPVQLASKASTAHRAAKVELSSVKESLSYAHGRLESLKASDARVKLRASDWDKKQLALIELLKSKNENFIKEKASKIKALEESWQLFEVQRGIDIAEMEELSLQEERAITPAISQETYSQLQHSLNLPTKYCSKCNQALNSYEEALSQLEAYERDVQANFDRSVRAGSYKKRAKLLFEAVNPHSAQLEALRHTDNAYHERLVEALDEENPFSSQLASYSLDIEAEVFSVAKLTAKTQELEQSIVSLGLIYDLSFSLRGELLRKAIQEIEDKTNYYLHTYFDGEIKVQFTLEDADKLEVSIQKSGYDCVYKQLSRGQRSMLRLCFSIAVMLGAANRAGLHFDNLFFDEVLDGLSEDLKMKSYDLFQELSKSHDSILVIDHASAFQNCFDKRYHVTLESDRSVIRMEE